MSDCQITLWPSLTHTEEVYFLNKGQCLGGCVSIRWALLVQ